MNKKLKEKTYEAFTSVLPITIIVLLLSIFAIPMYIGSVVMFLFGALLLIIGMGFFTLGAEMSMTPMGESIGGQLTKTDKVWLIAIIAFVMGIIITIAEPDLTVLANQVPAIPDIVLILTVAIGVGVFLVFAILRILFKKNLSIVLIVFYAIVFIVSFFVPENFLAVAFDSGGVTTGPITVPFIMALGLGFASMRNDKDSKDDSFGLVAICSIGPILAVLILGMCYNPQSATYNSPVLPDVLTTRDVTKEFIVEIPKYFSEVLMAVLPIMGVFLIFQIITRKYKKRQLAKVTIGYIYVLIGLALFLTGVNVGFIPVGYLIGFEVSGSNYQWLLVPLGMLIGYYIVQAEPAVHVLNKQVEDVSSGTIPQSAMKLSLAIGVAVSLGISMIRIITGISIYWFLIPGYAIALILTFFVPKIFVGIAFDSGGVVSGPLTSTFLLPFAIGACEATGGNVLTDAFGIVAMVAMTPLITIQLMGLLYSRKMKAATEIIDLEDTEEIFTIDDADDIIDYEEESDSE